MATAVERFAFEFEPRLTPFARLFGVRPQSAAVEVDDTDLRVRFGPWRLQTPLTNVAGAELTGPYAAWKVAGPARLSLADRGITFALSRRRGVCVRFVEPVPALLPTRRLRHPAATVTVERAEALIARLNRS